ncbi:hypothetical protein OXX79_003175 [Metschnikowia pulcherrima]
MNTIEVSSISGIPSAKVLSDTGERAYVTLPVVVLAMLDVGRMTFLQVTDFSPHPDSAFALEISPKRLPSEFMVGSKSVEPNEILTIAVTPSKVRYVWKTLASYGEPMTSHDYRDENRCNLAHMCIIVRLNFKIQTYQGGLEGFYGHIHAWERGPDGTDDLWEGEQLDGLMHRLSLRMTSSLYAQLSLRFPIGRYIDKFVASDAATTTQYAVSTSPVVKQSEPMQTQILTENVKKRRLDPRDAVFQQQLTQLPTQNEPYTFADVSGDAQSEEHDSFGARSENSSRTTTKTWRARNTVDFNTLSRIECHSLPKQTEFETKALIADIIPSPEAIFVKPFKRTLKISPFRVLLTKGDEWVTSEALSEQDVCHFFGVEEAEEVIHCMPELIMAMKSLLRKEVGISVKKQVKKLASGHEYSYWAIVSSLNFLADQIPHESQD